MKGFVDHYKVTEVLKNKRHSNHKIAVDKHNVVHNRYKKIPPAWRDFYTEGTHSVKGRCQVQHSWWQLC